jgi:hypothetical protein
MLVDLSQSAKFKFTKQALADSRFYDEAGEWFEPSVRAFFKGRTNEDIVRERMNGYIFIPVLDSESELQFECKLVDGCWELDFISTIGS